MAEGLLRRTLIALMIVRLVISAVLLGSAAFIQWSAAPGSQLWPLYGLIGLTFALSILYATVLKPSARHPWSLDLQLALDTLTVAAFVWVTGGITSYFSSLFALPIIAASIFQHRRGTLLVVVLGVLLYAAMVSVQYAVPGAASWVGWAGISLPLPSWQVALYTVAINAVGFLAVGALSASLAGRLKRRDEQLAEASTEIASLQAFSHHIINSLTMGLVTTDTGGRVLTFNRAAEAILGRRASDTLGSQAAHVLQLPPAFAAQLDGHADLAGNRRADYRYERADGTTIDLGLSVAPFLAADVRAGFVFSFQDVTLFRKLERDARMHQRLAAVGEMAAGIAHEIRNPLASMSGSIQLLRQELQLTEDQAQLMDIVLRESDRLNRTIGQFLAYARPRRFNVARFDVRLAVRDTALLLRHGTGVDERHSIDVDVPPDAVWCEADEGQVKQILWNLATNGIRAMPDGGRLRLAARFGPDQLEAILEVQDDGVGISEGELDTIFQPFRSGFAQGTGLGMAIVYRIVNDYGGEIRVTSQPGAGTTVQVRLPVQVKVAVQAQAQGA
ncbi:MAG: ATP-binding protein [Acidobacteria bacterium]|nr:ATP-binding protein [Acidobacteriota bacterium]